jgi:hypothetical protein
MLGRLEGDLEVDMTLESCQKKRKEKTRLDDCICLVN